MCFFNPTHSPRPQHMDSDIPPRESYPALMLEEVMEVFKCLRILFLKLFFQN